MLQEIDICLDERTVNLLLDFININLDEVSTADLEFNQSDSNQMVPNSKMESRKVYFQLLHMNPIKITLTFSTFYGERKSIS